LACSINWLTTTGFIYARDDRTVYVNLFIGSDADIALGDTQVHVRQQE
jgi:DUF1680 family protein